MITQLKFDTGHISAPHITTACKPAHRKHELISKSIDVLNMWLTFTLMVSVVDLKSGPQVKFSSFIVYTHCVHRTTKIKNT